MLEQATAGARRFPNIILTKIRLSADMAGRGRSGRGGGSGRGDGSGRGRGGRGATRTNKSVKTGLNKELEGNIFDLGERSSADLMRTTQIKIAQYIGSLYA